MTPHADGAPAVLSLLADGALRLEAEPRLLPLARRWLPLLPYDTTSPDPAGSVIRLAAGEPVRAEPAGQAVVRLGAASAWVDDGAARAELRCEGGSSGAVDLARGVAELVPVAGDLAENGVAAWDVFCLCTLASALLLGRMGRALVHAASIVAPDGGAWLLTGDAHAGKSTTTVNLISAGWRFVSDDNVILFRDAEGTLAVEGWPRRFHLDEGWETGEPLHRRGEVDPHERWPGQWLRTAPLAGLLFPRVAAQFPTQREPLAASQALGGLMRQSPWLLADRGAAPGVLSLLRAACEHPSHALRLGLDTYRDTDRLIGVIRPDPSEG